jgi:hypothetical protein
MVHAQMIALARELELTCKDGVKDNLDAGCVDVCKKSRAHSDEIMNLSVTELQGHMRIRNTLPIDEQRGLWPGARTQSGGPQVPVPRLMWSRRPSPSS